MPQNKLQTATNNPQPYKTANNKAIIKQLQVQTPLTKQLEARSTIFKAKIKNLGH